MKKLKILLAVYFLLLLAVQNLEAQPKFEKVTITVIEENVIELKAKMYGRFDELSGMNKAQAKTYLLQNYGVGFQVENYRELGWEIPTKPLGEINVLRIYESARDTIVYSTTLGNIPRNKLFVIKPYFSPNFNRYAFRYEGDAVGTRLQDYLCEPASVSLSESRLFVNPGDTVTIFGNVIMEESCNQEIDYSWEFKRDTSSVDSVVAFTDWMNWGEGRNGSIEIADNYIKFETMNKNWDRRRWRVSVSSGIGREVRSKIFVLRVNQE